MDVKGLLWAGRRIKSQILGNCFLASGGTICLSFSYGHLHQPRSCSRLETMDRYVRSVPIPSKQIFNAGYIGVLHTSVPRQTMACNPRWSYRH